MSSKIRHPLLGLRRCPAEENLPLELSGAKAPIPEAGRLIDPTKQLSALTYLRWLR